MGFLTVLKFFGERILLLRILDDNADDDALLEGPGSVGD